MVVVVVVPMKRVEAREVNRRQEHKETSRGVYKEDRQEKKKRDRAVRLWAHFRHAHTLMGHHPPPFFQR